MKSQWRDLSISATLGGHARKLVSKGCQGMTASSGRPRLPHPPPLKAEGSNHVGFVLACAGLKTTVHFVDLASADSQVFAAKF
jgi:hypothetical protein